MKTLALTTEAAAADALRRSHEQAVAAEIEQALAIAALCDLRQVDETIAIEGSERWLRVGSAGTPEVGEFVAGEIAGLLGVSIGSAFDRIATVLNLRHRHPTLWSAFLAGELRYWEGARVAQAAATAGLDETACQHLDRLCAQALRVQPWQRVRNQLEKWIILVDPARAAERAAARAADRHVTIGQIQDGHTELWGQLDAADGIMLDEALDHLSDELVGDTRRHRRAAALGVLARMVFGQDSLPGASADAAGDHRDITPNPARAPIDAVPSTGNSAPNRADDAGSGAGPSGRCLLGARVPRRAELVVHLDRTALTDPDTGVISIDRWGHSRMPQLRELLDGCQITVRPVVGIAEPPMSGVSRPPAAGVSGSPVVGVAEPPVVVTAPSAVDGYHIPDAMRLVVESRNPVDVFPYGVRNSRNCQLDHTTPFDHQDAVGRGQTRPDNLGPLSSYTHRLKTHGGWSLQQPGPGVFRWVSPLGYEYLVTAAGTTMLGRPTMPEHQRSHKDVPKRE